MVLNRGIGIRFVVEQRWISVSRLHNVWLAGGSRCFNRVPRALLVRMDWPKAKHTPSGNHVWTKLDVILKS